MLKEYLKLSRFYAAFASILLILTGYFMAGGGVPPEILYLALTGLFTHVWGFSHNDYCDIDIDKKTEFLGKKPMVSGAITKKNARLFITASFIISFILVFISKSIVLLAIYSVSALWGLSYNYYGKKIVGGDYMISLWAFFLFLTGTAVAKGTECFMYSDFLPALCAFFLILIFNCLGGIKDLKGDAKSFAKTFVIVLKSSVNENNQIKYSSLFIIYLFIQHFAFITSCFLFLHTNIIDRANFQNGFEANFLYYFIFLAVAIFSTASLINISALKVFNKERLWKSMAIYLLSAYLVVLYSFSFILGYMVLILYVAIPVAWFFPSVYFTYGRLRPVA